MARTHYTERPLKVLAEQYFVAADPPSISVCVCQVNPPYISGGAPHVHNKDVAFLLNDTDWIVTNRYSGNVSVMSDAEFKERFANSGPNAEPLAEPVPPPPIVHNSPLIGVMEPPHIPFEPIPIPEPIPPAEFLPDEPEPKRTTHPDGAVSDNRFQRPPDLPIIPTAGPDVPASGPDGSGNNETESGDRAAEGE